METRFHKYKQLREQINHEIILLQEKDKIFQVTKDYCDQLVQLNEAYFLPRITKHKKEFKLTKLSSAKSSLNFLSKDLANDIDNLKLDMQKVQQAWKNNPQLINRDKEVELRQDDVLFNENLKQINDQLTKSAQQFKRANNNFQHKKLFAHQEASKNQIKKMQNKRKKLEGLLKLFQITQDKIFIATRVVSRKGNWVYIVAAILFLCTVGLVCFALLY